MEGIEILRFSAMVVGRAVPCAKEFDNMQHYPDER
jgi:hypothetical protein